MISRRCRRSLTETFTINGPQPDTDQTADTGWTFLSNHGHVLVCLAQDPNQRLRDIAQRVGVTERSAFSIVHDLIHAGVLERVRLGRRNTYVVHADVSPHHTAKPTLSVHRLLTAIGEQ